MDDFDWRSAILDLSGELTSINFQRPFRGGYSIVYQGQWKGRIVAVKVLSPVGPLHSMKRKIQREGTIWATLNHPNVLPLLGFAEDENMFLPFGAFISPCCSCGSSEEYIHERGKVLSLRDRIELLRGTAKGVHYLHTFASPLIHGDIKPLNVLITEDGTPQLCDFGLARIILEEGSSGLTTTSIHGGTERYLAPELLEFDDSHLPTLEADLYALGCVGLKFTFLTPPYASRANNLRGQIFADIRSGLPPATFPEDMDPESESLSAIFRQTWDSDPSSRPNIQGFLLLLNNIDQGRSRSSSEYVTGILDMFEKDSHTNNGTNSAVLPSTSDANSSASTKSTSLDSGWETQSSEENALTSESLQLYTAPNTGTPEKATYSHSNRKALPTTRITDLTTAHKPFTASRRTESFDFARAMTHKSSPSQTLPPPPRKPRIPPRSRPIHLKSPTKPTNRSNHYIFKHITASNSKRPTTLLETSGNSHDRDQDRPMHFFHGNSTDISFVSKFPYPAPQEAILQDEKHAQELLAMILQQNAYRFTPIKNPSKFKNVLDIGCGRGYWVMEAAKEMKRANIIGFDLMDAFIKPHEMRERHSLDEAQIKRIEFVQGNFFNGLPFQTERFDFIRIAFLELAIPKTKWVPLLKEASRILKRRGHIEVIAEFIIFPTISSYSKVPDDDNLEEEFNQMLGNRDLVPVSRIGKKMFFDASFQVQTHQPVSVSIAPRPEGRSTDNRLMLLRKVYGEKWDSQSKINKGIAASPLDQDWSVLDALPPPGQIVTCQTCLIPGIIISPDIFVPMPEDTIYTHASHGARILQSTYLAMFLDKYPNAIEGDKIAKDFEEQWKAHVTRYERFEENTRKRIGCREKQFIDEDSEIFFPNPGPNTPRWKWFTFDEKIETPLEIRRFRAWTLTKPGKYIY